MRDYDGKTAAERVSERRDKLIPLCLTKPGPNPQPNSDFRSTRTLAHRPGPPGGDALCRAAFIQVPVKGGTTDPEVLGEFT